MCTDETQVSLMYIHTYGIRSQSVYFGTGLPRKHSRNAASSQGFILCHIFCKVYIYTGSLATGYPFSFGMVWGICTYCIVLYFSSQGRVPPDIVNLCLHPYAGMHS